MIRKTKVLNHLRNLNARRQQLGMSYAALANRSGIPIGTIKRILAGRESGASFFNVVAIAEALGIHVEFDRNSGIEELLEKQAQKQAERVVALTQGTSRLEGQGMDPETLRRLIRQTAREFLTGSKRKLWSE